MVGTLLLRGMLAGLVAGLLCFAFLRVAGEPSVDGAIAFESRMDAAKDGADIADATSPTTAAHEDHAELVSRPVQAGIGLLTGVVVYAASVGGLFALAFALAHGRMGGNGPRATAALLAGLAGCTDSPTALTPDPPRAARQRPSRPPPGRASPCSASPRSNRWSPAWCTRP